MSPGFRPLSPSARLPRAGSGRGLSATAICRKPFLSVTGTIDGDVLGNGSTAGNRAAVFDAQPAGNKYRVVFAEGDHAVFGGGDLRDAVWLDRVTRQANAATPAAAARLIQERTRIITLKFLDAWLPGRFGGQKMAAKGCSSRARRRRSVEREVARATLNKATRCSAPCFGMKYGRKTQQ